ncbi:DUF2254 domain-containing protein [Sphingomonas morindae]|uniref:DUF2254 domain-containing protein n=1 Tax=Sphingomonas morindae TaxID=1541170 RepID=A0ABY4X7W8_9SPHN|nr:DUF2254 domain-containing protein [Sphingomonas morindae]USI72964.1 DUF2254 domain-containing protein [Sphingomonas morindae]
MTRWQWLLRLVTRRMWFRAALMCGFGGALALAGALVGHTISYHFAATVGSKSVDSILTMLASSMLAVTTFSLTAMVSAYAGATSTITPRAVQLLIDDSTAQNALATFLGSFLFAIVGIVALSTGLYGETGRVILFFGTILVILMIVVTLLRWIEHIARFGRVSDTIDRVERAAMAAVERMAVPLALDYAPPAVAQSGMTGVPASTMARVTHVDIALLGEIADAATVDIHLLALPGRLAEPGRPLALIAGAVDEAVLEKVRQAFTLAHQRAFDHDPRFGLVVLSEIASRALSPAVNDPGTAIAVIEAGGRVLLRLLDHRSDGRTRLPARIHVPPTALADLLDDWCRPIARDGAAIVEVGVRLQKTLGALARHAPAARHVIAREALDAVKRARAALASEADRDLIERTHRAAFGA